MPTKPERDLVKEPLVPVVDLRNAVSSMVMAILAARVALDSQTAQLAKQYQENELLQQFQVPHFGIAEVTLRLPYAAFDVRPARAEEIKPGSPGEVPQMLVQVNAEVLAKLPAHAVGQVELKLTQEMLSLLMGEQQPG